jgi:uncharacterized membrane protein
MWATELVVTLLLHVLIGIVAALVYKATPTRTAATA